MEFKIEKAGERDYHAILDVMKHCSALQTRRVYESNPKQDLEKKAKKAN